MNEKEILAEALQVQAAQGPEGKVVVLLEDRFPLKKQHIAKMRLISSHKGPFGNILSIKENGTLVEFEAIKVIAYLGKKQHKKKVFRKPDKRIQFNTRIQEYLALLVQETAANTNITIGALVEKALQEFFRTEACRV